MDGNMGTNDKSKESGSHMEGTVTVEQGISLNSFEEFYNAKRPHLVRTLVIVLGNRELGIEAADEAMTRAYQRWSDVQAYDNPGGWVYRVAMNWAHSKLRRSKRELPSIYVTDKPHIEDPQFEPKLDAALASLPEKYRAPVVLRYYMDWSMEEISESLGIPKGTVKSRIHRGVAALQRSLGEAT
jgi:RNA polymerase sigma-70 factor (ECF subfamily)